MIKVQLKQLTAESLKKTIIDAGATLVGFGDVSVGLAKEFIHLPLAISIAVRHFPMEIIKTPRVMAYSNQLVTIDKKLEHIQKMVVSILKKHGYKCLAIPPDSMRKDNRLIAKLYTLFPHKTAATCSGLGWIGKSGLLVNEHFGPRLSWASILTNAPLEISARPYFTSQCRRCKSCINICPVGAIDDQQWIRGVIRPSVNYNLCAAHLERNRLVLGKAVCGLCMVACPKGRGDVEEAGIWQLLK